MNRSALFGSLLAHAAALGAVWLWVVPSPDGGAAERSVLVATYAESRPAPERPPEPPAEPPPPPPPAEPVEADPPPAEEPPVDDLPPVVVVEAPLPESPPLRRGDLRLATPLRRPAAEPPAAAPAPPPAPAVAPPVRPVKRTPPTVVERRPPSYPLRARRAGLEGRVVLLVHLSAKGDVEKVRVAQSSGHAELDRAAVATIESWVFTPGRRDGRPEAATVRIPVDFVLR